MNSILSRSWYRLVSQAVSLWFLFGPLGSTALSPKLVSLLSFLEMGVLAQAALGCRYNSVSQGTGPSNGKP